MTISLGLGSRLPAHCTSMGRVLLAELSPEELHAVLPPELAPRTDRTITSRRALEDVLDQVRLQGWALVDEELEIGVRSIAAPLRDSTGRAIAAMNVSTHAGRTTVDELHEQFVPALVATAKEISDAFAKR